MLNNGIDYIAEFEKALKLARTNLPRLERLAERESLLLQDTSQARSYASKIRVFASLAGIDVLEHKEASRYLKILDRIGETGYRFS